MSLFLIIEGDSNIDETLRGSPLAEYMKPEIPNGGYLSGTFELSDIQNGYPRHPQNFQVQYPLAGIDWYSAQLDRGGSTSSGFIERAIHW